MSALNKVSPLFRTIPTEVDQITPPHFMQNLFKLSPTTIPCSPYTLLGNLLILKRVNIVNIKTIDRTVIIIMLLFYLNLFSLNKIKNIL